MFARLHCSLVPRTSGLLLVLALGATLTLSLEPAHERSAGDEEPPTPEAELWAQAERDYAKGRYDRAVSTYSELAKRFPDTEEGKRAARRCLPSGYLGTTPLEPQGPSANRIDVALMGDGYQLDDQKSFDKLAEDVPAMFAKQKTYGEYLSYFNFHRVNLVSKDDGVDGYGREEDTALNGHVIGTIQGHVAIDRPLVVAMMREMPVHDDYAVVFVRTGNLGTGGSGVATIGGRNAKTLVHEWGHAFCGLGDEYASQTHDRGAVGRTVNVSPTDDPAQVPWAHWIEAKVPGVGVYEGAAGQVRGAWKATSGGCVMEDGEFFCPPCREEIVLHIYRQVDPIDSVLPEAQPRDYRRSGIEALGGREPHQFELQALYPDTNPPYGRWWDIRPSARHPSRRPGRCVGAAIAVRAVRSPRSTPSPSRAPRAPATASTRSCSIRATTSPGSTA